MAIAKEVSGVRCQPGPRLQRAVALIKDGNDAVSFHNKE